jgi:hypothetical protein
VEHRKGVSWRYLLDAARYTNSARTIFNTTDDKIILLTLEYLETFMSKQLRSVSSVFSFSETESNSKIISGQTKLDSHSEWLRTIFLSCLYRFWWQKTPRPRLAAETPRVPERFRHFSPRSESSGSFFLFIIRHTSPCRSLDLNFL